MLFTHSRSFRHYGHSKIILSKHTEHIINVHVQYLYTARFVSKQTIHLFPRIYGMTYLEKKRFSVKKNCLFITKKYLCKVVRLLVCINFDFDLICICIITPKKEFHKTHTITIFINCLIT